VDGLTYQPRLDAGTTGTTGTTGTVTGYRIEVGSEGSTSTKVADGQWSDDKELKWAAFTSAQARCGRLTATSGDSGYASAAEIRLRQSG
jgi:hypothetical protein